ncbi:hypothetical protein RvY_16648 [Ramazzottius varieornatus]|uniref:Dehydrogenase/reductase SDR family member 11 n=1 Tax=Ramazzottius varieornatus TaxID=947166 RepID=A0A1D1W1X7_RAMVA|nr:hypothetical protein RvY_16648 [Ramazzottius varieornatus]
MLDLNVLGVSICTREALRLMFKDGVDDGHIININSVVGHFINDIADTHFYSATKHMITALTKALNAELRQKKTKIRVTSISPGITETPLMSRLGEGNDKFKIGDWSGFLKGKDIADAVLYVVGAPPHVNIRELTIAEIGFAGC